MFHKTIEAVRAAQAAAQAELDALLVPPDPATGQGGGFHWHATGSAILQNAIRGLDGLASELEKRQGPIDEADAAAKKAEEDAAKADADQKEREAAAAAEEGAETPSQETAETEVPA